jgi:hypothetical protein
MQQSESSIFAVQLFVETFINSKMFFFFGRRLRDNENYTSLYPYPEPAAGD